jgi:hypothetical protein
MTTDLDKLQMAAKTHVGGMALAAASLMKKLDRPGITIEMLRASSEAQIFRQQVKDLNAWFYASIAALPESVFTLEEKRIAHYLFAEKERG